MNNLADPQCWRCGGVLLPLDSPVPAARFEHELAVPAMPTEEELEQELVALEQEVEALERAPGSAAAPPPAVEHGFRGSSIPGPKAVDPRPRTAAPAFRGSNIPEPRTLFVREEDASWRRRRGLVVAAFVVALGSAIAVGAYLRDRDGASPDTAASAAPPSEMRAEPSTAPRVASGVAEAPGAVPATSPAPKALDAPIERRLASDAGEAPAVPAPAAAPEPSCPPAVEAMALCEWLVRANGQ